jgi:uncharacterized protein (TIGR02284 family)
MDTQEIVKRLIDLCQLDIDASNAYEQAIKNVDDANIRQKLEQFRGDHERHVNDLSSHIRRHGGEPPEHKPGVKGFVLQGFTAIRSAIGTESALKAMRSNENLTNRTYADALEWDTPDDVKQLIRKNYEDEQRHLRYIEDCLRDRPWEAQPRA